MPGADILIAEYPGGILILVGNNQIPPVAALVATFDGGPVRPLDSIVRPEPQLILGGSAVVVQLAYRELVLQPKWCVQGLIAGLVGLIPRCSNRGPELVRRRHSPRVPTNSDPVLNEHA